MTVTTACGCDGPERTTSESLGNQGLCECAQAPLNDFGDGSLEAPLINFNVEPDKCNQTCNREIANKTQGEQLLEDGIESTLADPPKTKKKQTVHWSDRLVTTIDQPERTSGATTPRPHLTSHCPIYPLNLSDLDEIEQRLLGGDERDLANASDFGGKEGVTASNPPDVGGIADSKEGVTETKPLDAGGIVEGDCEAPEAEADKGARFKELEKDLGRLQMQGRELSSRRTWLNHQRKRVIETGKSHQCGKYLGAKASRALSEDAQRSVDKIDAQLHRLRQQMEKYQAELIEAVTRTDSDEWEEFMISSKRVLNPNCKATEEDEKADDDEHQLHDAPGLERIREDRRHIFLKVQIEETSTEAVDADAQLEVDEEAMSKPFYNVEAINLMRTRYTATTTHLKFSDGQGGQVETKVVVDSGAANSAIGINTVRRKYPHLEAKITAPDPDQHFHDASGKLMPVVGNLLMEMCIGTHCFTTEVIVFQHLSTDFLLGTNTLRSEGLVIDVGGGQLYAKGNCSQVACLATTNEPATMQFDFESRVLHVDLGDEREKITCESEALPKGFRGSTPDLKGWSTQVKLEQDVVVPKGARNMGLRLVYDQLYDGEGTELELILSKEISARYPGLVMPRAQRLSSLDFHARVSVSNMTQEDIKIPMGIVGTAYAVKIAKTKPLSTEKGPCILAVELEDDSEKPFPQGPPSTRDHMHDLGLDLSQATDPTKPLGGGRYAPLSEEWKDRLYKIAMRWHQVWSRDARVPRISKLVIIDIPTGTATPIQQKPYGIPRKYMAAVREELDKLLKAGLIEPSMSNWTSPTLLTVKKDSTTDKLKVKIVVDYRRLNEVTLVDGGGLGNQNEILDSFGGGKIFNGICDAAGGFYQFLLNPLHKHRSTFILPTSMGGTAFQWRVAPYGLQRNPAGYSRGMMFALQNLVDTPLAPMGQSGGSAYSWIDDITMSADSMEGFADLFERVLTRISFAGMSLKGEKCHLLRSQLEVLGFVVTPEGIKMNPDKTEAFTRMPEPTTVDEIRTFLGMVNFYRRFIPRIGMLAAPMHHALKKDSEHNQQAIGESFRAIKEYLLSDEVCHAPDFKDPRAEFAIVTDACTVSAGATLLQWQHPSGEGPGPPELMEAAKKGTDELTQSWRLEAGWKLVTIGHYSKTFVQAQRHWPVFDKEAGAIILALRHWAEIVTQCKVTVYTDSKVAASMLSNKNGGPPRLQRWGMELMSFLPYLKIGYRIGKDNGLADLLSRYPTFRRYRPLEDMSDQETMPEDLFEQVGGAPDTTTNRSPMEREVARLGYQLWECKQPVVVERIWEAADDYAPPTVRSLTMAENKANKTLEEAEFIGMIGYGSPSGVPSATAAMEGAKAPGELVAKIEALRCLVENTQFHKEQRAFEEVQDKLELYVSLFHTIHGRAPVIYDLYCGEGGYSRGARLAGARCYGFDNDPKCAARYEYDYSTQPRELSGMSYTCVDLDQEVFWEELQARGRYRDYPPPDIIHVSPPCQGLTRLSGLGREGTNSEEGRPRIDGSRIVSTIRRLKTLEAAPVFQGDRSIVWQVENVVESLTYLGKRDEHLYHRALLCGTMMGHRVYKRRVFYCSYAIDVTLEPNHEGKAVGRRGMSGNSSYDAVKGFGSHPGQDDSNMYGVYSRPSSNRGSLSEWHGAMGFPPRTFTARRIGGVLPMGYGRYMTAQMVAHLLHARWGVPLENPSTMLPDKLAIFRQWIARGYVQAPPLVRVTNEMLSVERQGDWAIGTRVRVKPCQAEHSIKGIILDKRATGDELHSDDQIQVQYEESGECVWHSLADTTVRRGTVPVNDPDKMTDAERAAVALKELRKEAGEEVSTTESEEVSSGEEGASSPDRVGRHPLGETACDITPGDQLKDPWCAVLIRRLQKQGAPQYIKARNDSNWSLHQKLLVRTYVGEDEEAHQQIAVPVVQRRELMAFHHYLGHRSGEELYQELGMRYYWPTMEHDCLEYKKQCEICGERASLPRPILPEGTAPTPQHPFSVLHLDCKTGLPISGGYTRVLVVVCALTRYTILIPMEGGRGIDVFRALLNHVFKYFSTPQVIICDNGSEFRNRLMSAMGEYLGYRKIHVLPYSPQANGMAEAAVKRLKLILDKHLERYKSWDKSLCFIQLKLNAVVHPGHKMSAYFAVFGREATQALALEGPRLPATTPIGDIFLRSLHGRVRDIHENIYLRSQEIRKLRHERRNAKRLKSRKAEAPIKVGDYVYLLYRDWERAAYIRKHGKGQPWKHRYRVLDVSQEYGIKLEVTDKRGVLEWQPRRRVAHAPFQPHAGGETFDKPDVIGAYRVQGEQLGQNESREEGFDMASPTLLRVVDARYTGGDHLSIQVEWHGTEDKFVGETDYDHAYRCCDTEAKKQQLSQAVELARLRAGLPDEGDDREEGTVENGEEAHDEKGQTYLVGWLGLRKEVRENAWKEMCGFMSNYYREMISAFLFLGSGAMSVC